MFKPAHAQILACLQREPSLSRAQLHRRTGIRPNTVGHAVDQLVGQGLLRLGQLRSRGRGPRHEELELDPSRRYVAGLAIMPGRVEACRTNLRGKIVGRVYRRRAATSGRLISAAVALAKRVADPSDCLAVGLSIPGFVEPDSHRVATSAAFPGRRGVDLQPIFDAVGRVPVICDSQIHSMSTRWLLADGRAPDQAVLLVSLHDGEIGASFLLGGRPCTGRLVAGNELGHTQLPVDTERCYCGQVGCIERIFSTDHYRQLGGAGRNLTSALERFATRDDAALDEITGLLAMSTGNAVNFARPDRLVLAGDVVRHDAWAGRLASRITDRIFPELAQNMQTQAWPTDCAGTAITASWLALSGVFGIRETVQPAEV